MHMDMLQRFGGGWEYMEQAVYNNAKAKGFHEGDINFGEKISLIHSELSEALEADRAGNPDSEKIAATSVEEELADAVIRIMDLGAAMRLDIAGAIIAKHEYNLTRPHKHGGKKY